MSVLDYVILGGFFIAIAFIVVWMIRRKRRCKGGGVGCPYSGQCGK